MLGSVRAHSALRRRALWLLLLPGASAWALTHEEEGVWQTYMVVEKCKALKPELAGRIAPAYDAWARRHAQALANVRKAPTLQRERERMLAETAREREQGGMGFALAHCREDVLQRVLAPPPSADPRFATPDRTWAQLKEALRAGDAAAALACMTSELLAQLQGVLPELSAGTLGRMGESLQALRLDSSGSEDARYGLVEGADGVLAEVMFVRVRGNWKIRAL